MKNEMEIKDDIYHLLKDSDLIKNVSGKLSKTKRPDGSDKEDVVISVLGENPDVQVQELYLNVNVYVADVKRGNQYEENAIRLKELMMLSKNARPCQREGLSHNTRRPKSLRGSRQERAFYQQQNFVSLL